jgi:hydrogenase expression/formation protein HypE
MSDTRPLNGIVQSLLDEFGEQIHMLRDPTRGGVATVLNEIAKDGMVGVEIAQSKVPLEDEVSGACEMLGLDPLYVANEGLFLSVVETTVADAYVHTCKNGSMVTRQQ